MKNENEMEQLNLSLEQQASFPLGFAKVFSKEISSNEVEAKITVSTKKYKKSDLFSLVVEKPISKF